MKWDKASDLAIDIITKYIEKERSVSPQEIFVELHDWVSTGKVLPHERANWLLWVKKDIFPESSFDLYKNSTLKDNDLLHYLGKLNGEDYYVIYDPDENK